MNFLELGAKLSLDSSDYERGLGKAKSLASAMGTGIGKIMKFGALAIGAATTAAVAFGAASVKTGMEFDKSMSQVAATMGKTMEEMENEVGSVETSFGHFEGTLRDFAQFMGSNTAFSATQAADALNYMALAGYDTQTSMAMLPNVLNLAAAGGMELARASDMVTDTQTAFGISLERTSQMVDEMAKAASTGNTSVEQLGDAFLTVGGLAQELNGGFVTLADGTVAPVDGVQELEIALTAMANAGIKGSEAGTHMRNMLLKLASPTSDGTKQLEALGVSVFDAEGNMRSMKDIMGDLGGALGELTQEEKINAISDLFNTRDLASAEALLNAVGEDWDDIGASILDAEGAAAKMAETQLDNLAGDVTLFKSALEGVQIAVSDELTPSLREFVQFGTKGLSELTSAFKEGGLSGAMETFGKLLSEGLALLMKKLPSFVEAGVKLAGALGQGIIDNLPLLVNSGLEILTTVGTAIIAGFPKLIEAAASIISILAEGLSSSLPTLIPAMVEAVAQMADALINNIDTVVDAAIAIVSALADGIIAALPVLVERLPELVQKLGETIIENAQVLLAAALEIITTLADGLIEYLPLLLDMAVDLILELVDMLIENVDSLVDAAMEIVTALAEGIIEMLPVLAEKAPEIIGKLVSALIENLPTLIEAALEIIVALGQGLIENLPLLIESVVQLVTGLVEMLIENVPLLVDAAIQIIIALANGLIAALPTIIEQAPVILASLVTALINAAPQLLSAALQMIVQLASGISQNMSQIIAKGREIITTIGNAITGAVSRLVAKGREIVSKVVSGVKGAVSTVISAGRSLVEGIWSGISNALGWIKTKITGWVGNVTSFIKNLFGISSPSKVMRDEVGKWLALGIGEGFVDEMSNVERMMQDAMPDVSGMVGTVNLGVSTGYRNRAQSDVIELLREIRDNMDTDLVLQDGTLIGWMDKALGKRAAQRARGNA